MSATASGRATADWIDQTHVGDCRELLAQMIADGMRVQTCITSPPYYGLRDYGTATWEGGLHTCDHCEKRGGKGTKFAERVSSAGMQQYQYRLICRMCGARRVDRQIGLEPTPSEYVNELVSVFRLVRSLLNRRWHALAQSRGYIRGPCRTGRQ
jgi:hypothetical protein